MNNLTALIETKSNYANLNGEWVKIIKFFGTLVECEIECEGKIVTTTFSLCEIKSIKNT